MHPQLVEQGAEVMAVVDEPVAARSGPGQLVRRPHAHQIGRQAPATVRDPAQDVPPQVGRRRVAVQEHDRIAVPDLATGHPQRVHPRIPDRCHPLSLPHHVRRRGRAREIGIQACVQGFAALRSAYKSVTCPAPTHLDRRRRPQAHPAHGRRARRGLELPRRNPTTGQRTLRRARPALRRHRPRPIPDPPVGTDPRPREARGLQEQVRGFVAVGITEFILMVTADAVAQAELMCRSAYEVICR